MARDSKAGGTGDLQHLALSIYIRSLHKAAMDHSSRLVLAVSGKAMGCHRVWGFHISPQTASLLPASLKAHAAFEDNIFKSLPTLLRGYF